MPKRLTEEEVHERIKEKHGDKLRMTGGYERAGKNANFECNVCGHQWTTILDSVLRGSGCSKCDKKSKRIKAAEKYQVKFEAKFADTLKVNSPYEGFQKPIDLECQVCGEEFTATTRTVIEGVGCKECDKEARELDTHERIEAEHGGKLSMVGGFERVGNPADFECNVCGHQWTTIPSSVMAGSGCLKCADKRGTKKRQSKEEDVHIQIKKEHNEKLRMTGGYERVGKNANFECNVCGHQWTTTPASVLGGSGCSKCADKIKSKNQNSLTEYFKDHLLGVELLSNYYPYILKTKQNPRGLELDFYWPELKIALELDGEQHFGAVKHWGGQEKFVQIQANDKRKNKLCKKNGIHLIRVDGRKFKYGMKEEQRAEMFNEMVQEIIHIARSKDLIGIDLTK